MGKRSAGARAFSPEAWAEYLRAFRDPACIHAMCEDYRAAATIDLVHDCVDRDAGTKLTCPLRVLWGIYGIVERCFDPLADWGLVAETVSGRELDCGHYIPKKRRRLC